MNRPSPDEMKAIMEAEKRQKRQKTYHWRWEWKEIWRIYYSEDIDKTIIDYYELKQWGFDYVLQPMHKQTIIDGKVFLDNIKQNDFWKTNN